MSPAGKITESLHEGERRVVTVVFGDVKGFTAMSEKLDPEEVREIMNRAFSLLSEVVYAHGGIVDKYVGDCLMALFGVPQAREDDAVRAVQASLRMQEVLAAFAEELKRTRGFSIGMRIGVNTGLVLAGDVGSSLKADFTVMGDAVNTASRIEHAAAAGKVWIGAETLRFVGGRFKVRKLKPVAVKGKVKKLQLFEVEGASDDPSAPAPGLKSVVVGRQKELGSLQDSLEAALSGDCHVVSLVGEAGMGKTVLLRKFLQETAPQVEAGRLRLFRVTCPPQGTGPYGLFTEVARLLPGGPALPAEDAANWKEAYFLEFERWLMRRAAEKPMLLVFEDIHFADAGSWELLGFLVNRLRRLPVMILCVLRPDSEKNLYWHSAENYSHVLLKPFPLGTGVQAVEKILGRNKLPPALKESLVKKAGGHPYFLTELLWKLTETGQLVRKEGAWSPAGPGLRVGIPDTVQATLTARIDHLPAEERELLQAASVLGLEVDRRVLERLAPGESRIARLLENLVTKRFLTKAIKPGESAESYEFIHVLLQEVCYEGLIKGKKESYHLQAAHALESLHPSQEGPVLKAVADHYYRTRMKDKALSTLYQFAQRAFRRFAVDQAILYHGRCLEMIEQGASQDSITREAVLFHLGELGILAFSLDAAFSRFEECLKGSKPGDPLRIEALRKMGRICNIQGRPQEGLRLFTEAAAASGVLTERQRLELYYEIAAFHFRGGDEAAASEWLGKVRDGARGLGLAPELPETKDIHELLPAFSFLTDR